VELDNTQITDAGLDHLHPLSQLVFVSYLGTKVTSQGAQKLKQALPKLTHP
jgi:hypothetical protein